MNHICGKCLNSLNSEKEYTDHLCEVTGFQPTQNEHLGPEFKKVSDAALERGNSRQHQNESKV